MINLNEIKLNKMEIKFIENNIINDYLESIKNGMNFDDFYNYYIIGNDDYLMDYNNMNYKMYSIEFDLVYNYKLFLIMNYIYKNLISKNNMNYIMNNLNDYGINENNLNDYLKFKNEFSWNENIEFLYNNKICKIEMN